MKTRVVALSAVVALTAALSLAARAAVAQEEYDPQLYDTELKAGHALILVTVEDDGGKPLEGVIVSVKQGARMPYSKLSDARGRVLLVVPSGFRYELRFVSLDVSQTDHVEVFDIPEEDEQRFNLVMTYTPPTDKVFILKGVFFDTNKTTIKPASTPALTNLYEYLKMKSSVVIELSGHTDSVGSDEDNQILSDGRAKAVREWLVKKGIAENRITAVGFGESQPIDTNDTAAGRERNRRTEVRVVSE
jgi:outer membrane protein OmpA-like peptidoglycan-associated protein